MRLTQCLLALRRRPERKGFLGMEWTQWPWPSYLIAAVYRRFGPRMHLDEATRTKGQVTSSLFYMVTSWVVLGGVVAYSGGFARAPNLPDEKTEAEVQAVSMLLHK